MNIGDRIKKLRKELDLTQRAFGERIGVKGNTIAQYELGRSNPVDSVISLIIREFNINEEWLRAGIGEMFKPTPSDSLDQLAREYSLSSASYIAIEKFVNLKPEKRNELIEFFLEISKAIIESEAESEFSGNGISNFPDSPEELEDQFPPLGSEADGKVG